MHSLLKSSKAQFFILSAVAIIFILFLLSKLFEPSNVIDTSSVILNEAPFIFENIKEKAVITVSGSKSCQDANFNLQEYKSFVESYALSKGYLLSFNYTATPCPNFVASINQRLEVAGISINNSYALTWP